MPKGKTITMRYALSKEGNYIGTTRTPFRLHRKFGIETFEVMRGQGNTCCIGYSKKREKWYGWSHRAIHGFSVGYTVKKNDCCASTGWTEDYLKDHPEEDLSVPIGFKAKNLHDCKKLAIAFAESVS